jgi:hypothetical protein
MELIKKISVKTVCGLPRKILGNLDKVLLMEVMGEVTGIETGKSDFKDENGETRDWTALIGQFRAQNCQTRNKYFAARCFLPAVVADHIIAQFTIGKAQGMQTLQFAILIGVKDAPDVAVGYEYYGQSLMPQENDPFAAIESKVEAAKHALPAPRAPNSPTEQDFENFGNDTPKAA